MLQIKQLTELPFDSYSAKKSNGRVHPLIKFSVQNSSLDLTADTKLPIAMASGMFVEVIKEVGLCLWNSGSKCLVHIRDLKENLKSLEVTMEQLMQIYEDVQQRVQTEELLLLAKRTSEVAGWFDEVQKLKEDVSKTLRNGEQNKCLAGYCPKNCWQSYKLGKRVRKMLDEVEKLKNNGRFNVVVAKMHNSVNKKPMDETVGLDPMLQKVWRCIEDKSLRVIGLYGIGVSKQPDVKNIQNTILQKLGLPEGSRFFLLLLDDIWERLDLNLVGIPLPDDQNESKVIFTTRLKEVCGLMGAQQNIKVECLAQEEALRLFRMKVGENILNSDPRIQQLAEDMAAECKGLPLALVTVGLAMASREVPEDWESEIAALRNTPSEFPGMDSVLLPLKFSFEKLQNATLKSCFLYCCLFPDGYNIRKEELIEYWRAGRFLDEYDRDGEYIIRSLKRACLLESGESEEFVRMHGLIRDMAWWECKDKVAIFIKKDAESDEERGLRIRNGVERLSSWDYSIEDVLINSSPSCIEHFCKNVTQLPNLRTMICKVPMLTTFPAGFFPLMSALTLLDSWVGHVKYFIRARDSHVLEELDGLPNLSEICIAIANEEASVEILIGSHKLQRCIRKLFLYSINGLTFLEVSPILLSRMEHLELWDWEDLVTLSPETYYPRHEFSLLRKMVILGCHSLSDVTWLIYAPNLLTLELSYCRKLCECIALWWEEKKKRRKNAHILQSYGSTFGEITFPT
ncbi:putative disease resistance protein [Quercus suber]|uniref:Disease resistance protein n=1 Tax=Quercus suber TaxID=58331 RepID=A0AAW0JLB1_QUESU